MRLNDLLPETYTYKDEEVAIDLSFDNILDIFDVLKIKDLFVTEIAELCIALLFGDDVIDTEDYIEVWNDVFELYLNSQEEEHIRYDLAGNPMPQKEKEQRGVIDLEQDAEYIYASFMQAYSINLFKQQTKLHWLEFKALLNGLPEGTIIKQIIQIRSWEPTKNDSSEYKEKMRELQDYYRLEVDE